MLLSIAAGSLLIAGGVNRQSWCNCIRVLIYLGLLFIYKAVDFWATLIACVRQDGMGIDRLDVRSDFLGEKLAMTWNVIESCILFWQTTEIWLKMIIIESLWCYLSLQGLCFPQVFYNLWQWWMSLCIAVLLSTLCAVKLFRKIPNTVSCKALMF